MSLAAKLSFGELPLRFGEGLVSGALATAPMSLVMIGGKSLLPPGEKYPLPPSEITGKIEEQVTDFLGVPEEMPDPATHHKLTLINHYAYGAACGGVLSLLPPLRKKWYGGLAFGLAVWAGSYLKLLPALKILTPATEHPARRNALMIVAHCVWGVSASKSLGLFQRD